MLKTARGLRVITGRELRVLIGSDMCEISCEVIAAASVVSVDEVDAAMQKQLLHAVERPEGKEVPKISLQ